MSIELPDGKDQARGVCGIRQRAFHPRQPQRSLGPGADPQPPQFHQTEMLRLEILRKAPWWFPTSLCRALPTATPFTPISRTRLPPGPRSAMGWLPRSRKCSRERNSAVSRLKSNKRSSLSAPGNCYSIERAPVRPTQELALCNLHQKAQPSPPFHRNGGLCMCRPTAGWRTSSSFLVNGDVGIPRFPRG